ncbi:peptide/nickel transport system ATP-binding protein [Halanaerobium saccharolyticum]|uniref:Peptide/nickel transport system ATP-binding protein n=1 Tax=Halanaerobium saccharolyticum TaxID=43595 RepID=A0A4V3G5D9_9FIRM|nr:ABC transporter ATP-binding protein [Halanaerobium saccharolyticum]RAK07836.1 peptide/nickel transport system ATP-binding protein [Halanaerobium saccharolyticum]TDW04450.1 peptide/nickel transport system ATP-binding protein [Halanaerobium saccharolyticum]TDX59786.1 peptide/nickel transport system ATP-binding protein [Halanaerobium saccharolyticum]
MSKLLEVKNLTVNFNTAEGIVRAVRGVDFEVDKNQVLGIVGESGCGKSVTARAVLNVLASNSEIMNGEVIYHKNNEKIDLLKLDKDGKEIRKIRGKEISMIFQEPMTSFSPVHTVGNQIMEAILLHTGLDKKEARQRAISILEEVGIPEAQSRIDDYPYQLSGGMRQRAMIAMALSCEPSLLLADEPTTALDVTIQAQILDLMRDMKEEFGMSIIIITHDIGVIAEIADQVAVMYLGRVVEEASVDDIFYDPKHPYTRALLKSIPKITKKDQKEKLLSIEGTVPDAYNIPSGCTFHNRCEEYMAGRCDKIQPELIEISPSHKVACLLYEKEGD